MTNSPDLNLKLSGRIQEKEKVEEVVVSEVAETNTIRVEDVFKPIKPSYSPDPTSYHGNYDERKITFGTVLSLLLGGM